MADYATVNTGRYKLKYTVLGKTHTMQWRYTSGAGTVPAGLITGMGAFLTALEPVLLDSWQMVSAEKSEEGDSFFVPSDIPTDTIVGVGPNTNTALRPHYMSFVGRSALGNRAVIYVFGHAFLPDSGAESSLSNYRVTTLEYSAILNAVAALTATTALRAIDNTAIVWYPYANLGTNAYYQRKARG